MCNWPLVRRPNALLLLLFASLFLVPIETRAQVSKTVVQQDWEKLLDAAKKEGKVTVSIPATAEMRKQVEENFRKKFGIEVEVFTARGS